MTLLLDQPRPVAPDIHDDATRREFLVGVGAALLLAACGADETTDAAAPTTTEADSAFPVTIEHKFGSTEIPAEPKRVVTVGFSDHDAVLALGIIPIGIRDWYAEHPSNTWPWAQESLGSATPEVIPQDELSFETVAALRPDVIIALYSGITAEDYETLSQIAPSVAQSGDYPDYGMPWREKTTTTGRALGRAELAQQRIDEVDEAYRKAAEDHPTFKGTTVAVATAKTARSASSGLGTAAASSSPRSASRSPTTSRSWPGPIVAPTRR